MYLFEVWVPMPAWGLKKQTFHIYRVELGFQTHLKPYILSETTLEMYCTTKDGVNMMHHV